MGVILFPSIQFCSASTPPSKSRSFPISPQTRNFPINRKNLDLNFGKLKKSLIPASWGSGQRRGLSLVSFDAAGSSGSTEEDPQALKTVLKLYSAIKEKKFRELSDTIADECQCVCSFISFFQPLQGKKEVLDFFCSLISYLGKNIELKVKPTLHDGMIVGVQWQLEWNKVHMPLGKGFSFHICQTYKGKVMIRNVEMFMEPLFHLQPLRLKILAYMTFVIDKITSITMTKERTKRIVYIIVVVGLMGIIMLLSKSRL